MIVSSGLSAGAGGEVNNHSGECGCLTVANPGEQMERIYTYDNNRNLIDIHAPDVPWYNQSFTYDALNRLTDATGRYGTTGYTYDDVGNRLTRAVNGETETYSYIPGTNKLQEITGANPTSFTYDANGNTTGMGDKTLTYNQNNRLIRVEENSVVLGEYTYNGLGQRVIKEADGVTTIFHYDLNGKLIAQSQADGAMTAQYLYIGKIRIAKVDVSTGSIYYYLNDRLGTPQIMTDDTGTIVWEATYKPFGDASVNPKSEIVNNFRLPGQYHDEETGLHYNYHRYHDPRTGRYLTPDPIALDDAINLYAYVSNDPINLIDILGLASLRYDPALNTIYFYDDIITYPYEARNDVTAGHTPIELGFYADDVYPHSIAPNPSFGPSDNTHIDTGHPGKKDIHGGGFCQEVSDPYADKQGWCFTWGCIRMQNTDIRDLSRRIINYKNQNPGARVPFEVIGR